MDTTTQSVGKGRNPKANSTGKLFPQSSTQNTYFTYSISPLPQTKPKSMAKTAPTSLTANMDQTKGQPIQPTSAANPSPPADQTTNECKASTSTRTTSTSDEFSHDEEDKSDDQNSNKASKGRPLHERIDARIQAKKEEHWKKGKIGQIKDPRPRAIIPIHPFKWKE